VSLITQYYDSQRVVSIIDEDYMQSYITMNETKVNRYGSVDFESAGNGKVKPIANNQIKVGKYDLIYLARPKSDSMSAERLRQNVELLKVLQSTDPQLVKYLVPDILKDSGSPSAKKIRDIIMEQDKKNTTTPQAKLDAQKAQDAQQLEFVYKQSQTNLNNAKAKALTDKNKIDLQKAFANNMIARENIKSKLQKSQLSSMRGVR
jgi:hypothetical protein